VQTVVIASGGVGSVRVIARRLAAEGAQVALVCSSTAVADIAGTLVAAGARSVLAIPCDVTQQREVAAAAARVEAELGPIDRWVNTAMSEYGFFCCTRAALARMRSRERGTIVQVSAPRAVKMFTEGLRGELRLAGSRIVLETVRTQPFRKAGALAMAGAAVVGAALLRRVGRH
jgi:NAD(P)-dependent dehydrogenase (short-subunit alcohol dehydrogenase family)